MDEVGLWVLLYFNLCCIEVVIELLCWGESVESFFDVIKIDCWFFLQFKEIMDVEKEIFDFGFIVEWKYEFWCEVKWLGFFDVWIGEIVGLFELEVCDFCKKVKVMFVYKMVDICVVEFEVYMLYYYSIYEWEDEVVFIDKFKVVILGSGFNCIGQGVEFDYVIVYVVWVFQEVGYEMIMVNFNFEMVSIDYDIVDCLYFELLIFEDVMNIVEYEKFVGVIV